MWSALPAHILIDIICYIKDCKSKIAASSICKSWRDIVFDNQDVVLKSKHVFRFTCVDQQNAGATEEDVELMIKCVPHVETLVFEWCKCKTSDLLNALSKILATPLAVKQIMFHGNVTISRTCSSTMLDEGIIESLKSLVCSLLRSSTKLKALDLGFEPDLAQSVHIMQEIKSKLSRRKLAILNIAALRNKDLTADVFYTEINQLNMLKTLCLSWNKNLVELIKVLSEDSDSQSLLKELIVVVSSWHCLEDHSVPEEHISKVSKFHPELKLKVVLINGHIPYSIPFHHVDALEQMNIMFGYHQVSFTLITNEREPDQFLCPLLVWGANGSRPTLQELSLHYVDSEVKTNMQLTELVSFTAVTYNVMLTGLQRLELCGMLIKDVAVLDLAGILHRLQPLQPPSVFKDLVVYHMDVLCSNETNDLYLPIGSSQVNDLEATISEMLSTDWKLVRDHHSHRDRSSVDIHSKFRNTLQDICKVVN